MVIFNYTELSSNTQIRILTLHPGDDRDSLRGTLSERKNEEYEALSWTWGSEDEDSFIDLFADHSPGGRMLIKPNLECALKHLRRQHEKRVLWVDAICINQPNSVERNAQVKMMADTYGKAANVCVWLGDEKGGESERAIKFIKEKISNLGAFDDHITDEKYNDDWHALGALMTCKWFSRRWIIQEIALAKVATVYYGDQSVDWEEFVLAVALFEKGSPRVSTLFKGSADFGNDPEYFGAVQALGACQLIRTTTNLFRRSHDRTKIVDYLFTLEDLVSTLSSFEAKDPHDTFYAVMSLAKDVQARINRPDSPNQFPVDRKAQTWLPVQGPMGSEKKHPLDPDESDQPSQKRARMDTSQIDEDSLSNDMSPDEARQVGTIPEMRVVKGEGLRHHRTNSAPSQANSPSGMMSKKQKELAGRVAAQFRKVRHPENKRIFDVDYEQPFFAVCKQFLAFVLPKSGNLDILLRPWAPEDNDLPSWIPTLDRTAFAPRRAKSAAGDYKMNRRNGDPLVGQTARTKKIYDASKRPAKPDDWEFSGTRSLLVRGFELDRIGQLTEASQLGNIPEEWLKLSGWPAKRASRQSYEVGPPPDEFWRTLVAERSPDGLNPPAYYPGACRYAASHSVDGGGIDTRDLKNYGGSTITAEFLERVQSVVYKRKMFRTRKGGSLERMSGSGSGGSEGGRS